MTVDEAERLLAIAPRGDQPSRINPAMSQRQAVEIIEAGLVGIEAKAKWGNREFDRLRELRVYQAVCNLRRPKAKSIDKVRAKAGLQ